MIAADGSVLGWNRGDIADSRDAIDYTTTSLDISLKSRRLLRGFESTPVHDSSLNARERRFVGRKFGG